MNMMEETRGVYRVEFVGMSIREIKAVLEDKWGSMVWSGGRAYPSGDITLRMLAAPSKAAEDVMGERHRQIHAEGWTAKHDDQHSDGSMALAAACYALNAAVWADRPKAIPQSDYVRLANPGYRWPWAEKWWKPKSQRQDLVRAAALLLAEIDRLDRAEAKGGAA